MSHGLDLSRRGDFLLRGAEFGEHDLAEDLARTMGRIPGVFLGGEVGHDQELDGLKNHQEPGRTIGGGSPSDHPGDLLGRHLLMAGVVDELDPGSPPHSSVSFFSFFQ